MKFPGDKKQRRIAIRELKKLLKLKNGDWLRVGGSLLHCGVCSFLAEVCFPTKESNLIMWVMASATKKQSAMMGSFDDPRYIDKYCYMTPIRRRLVKTLIGALEREIEGEKKVVK